MSDKTFTDQGIISILNDAKINNLSIKEVAVKNGITATTIRGWLKKTGLKLKRGRTAKHDWEAIKAALI